MAKLKYELRLDEYEITSLDHADLAPSFKLAAQEFEKKRAANQLSDEQILEEDEKLLNLFDDIHDLKNVDSEETKKLKEENLILKGKETISNTKTIDGLKGLKQDAAIKEFPELIALIDQEIQTIALGAATQAIEQAKDIISLDKLKLKYKENKDLVALIDQKIQTITEKSASAALSAATQAIEQAKDIDALKVLKEKYKNNKDLVAIIDKKIKTIEEKNTADLLSNKEATKKKLIDQKVWDYPQLKAIGIQPTGDDIKLTDLGVFLERNYMFKTYNAKSL